MFLKSLTISGTSGDIRQINFKKGVNLIVDHSAGKNESGNNVGKTTILRLVDYCLGSSGKNIYTDPEFGTESEVKDFLVEEQILVTLVLARNLDSNAAPKITIERNFLSYSDKIQKIDEVSYNNMEFPRRLAELIFQQTESKPTLRQLVAKNIRDEKAKLNHILKVLDGYTSAIAYETLYQFWLGVNTSDGHDYQQVKDQHRKQETYKTQLAKQFSITDFQIIPTIQSTIDGLQQQKEQLNLAPDYQKRLDAFDAIKAEMSQIGTRLSVISLRKELIEESRRSLEEDVSKVSVEEIKSFYAEAKILIPGLQKSFEESVHFHNQMIANKLEFITKELPVLTASEQELTSRLQKMEAEAGNYKDLLSSDKTLIALERLNLELQQLIQRHAKLSEQERIWNTCLSDLETLGSKLAAYSDQAKQLNEQIADNLRVFNESLKRISIALYGQQYVLAKATVDKNGKELKQLQFEMPGVSSNPGTGEKKGHITAFDLAYIEFAEKLGIPHLNFIMHDQIENVDDRQIVTILEKLVPSINCQYIAPILKDKIPEGIDIEKYKIVELSQDEKLFKL
ncbi:MAG: DUF2326 domain-containing protein [Luteolibacter sp.]